MDDLCEWLDHVNLGVCVPVVRQHNLTPTRFKALDPEEQEALGVQAGIGAALVEAWRLFALRVFPTSQAVADEATDSSTPALQLGQPNVSASAAAPDHSFAWWTLELRAAVVGRGESECVYVRDRLCVRVCKTVRERVCVRV